MSCSVLLCQKECLFDHIKQECSIVSVKHSKAEEGVIPFCEHHKCFSKNYCVNCLTYICAYCKYHACNKGPQHKCLSLSEFSSSLNESYEQFQSKAERVKATCQKTKAEISSVVNDKVPELRNYISNFKYKLLATTLLTLNKVEDELCAKFMESSKEYKTENNQNLNKAKKVLSGMKKISEYNSGGFAKMLHFQKLKELSENLEDDAEENDFSVKFEAGDASFEKNMFRLIDASIGKVTLSMNENDKTEILPQSDAVKDCTELVKMRMEDSVGDNETYKRNFFNLIAPELNAQKTGINIFYLYLFIYSKLKTLLGLQISLKY